jgi:hypothetical protein
VSSSPEDSLLVKSLHHYFEQATQVKEVEYWKYNGVKYVPVQQSCTCWSMGLITQPLYGRMQYLCQNIKNVVFNHLMPNGHFSGRTAPLTYRCCILYIYSTNIRTEYFKRCTLSVFPSSKCRLFHNATFFVSFIIHILNTECAKI